MVEPFSEEITCHQDILDYGFIQVPVRMLLNNEISPGAKLAYSALLWYWWRGHGYPGHAQAALDWSIPERSWKRYMAELTAHCLINVLRRGRGKPNVYHIPPPRLPGTYTDPALPPAKDPHPDLVHKRPSQLARDPDVRTLIREGVAEVIQKGQSGPSQTEQGQSGPLPQATSAPHEGQIGPPSRLDVQA